MSDPLRSSVRRRFSWVIVSAAIVAVPGVTPASFAHNVETDGDVGATFHLEPDHNPKSGEPATVWFALTRDGGETIPLSDCDCTLSIVNTQDETKAIEAPELTAIDVETYTDIPSAEVVFPEAGLYAVKLSGTPSATAAEPFEAFELSYDVTARPGDAQDDADTTTEATSNEPASSDTSATAADEADDTDQAGKMQHNPVVDSWVWFILSLLMLGAGAVLGSIVLGRFVLGVIRQRQGRSPRRPKTNRSQPTEPTIKPTDSTPTNSAPASESVRESTRESDRTDPAANETKTEAVTTSAATSSATSAIAAEAKPAPDSSTGSNSANSTNSASPTDAISSIKDWD